MRYGGWLFISPSNFLILPTASILHNLNATFFPPWKDTSCEDNLMANDSRSIS
jgi:hypothetical protein